MLYPNSDFKHEAKAAELLDLIFTKIEFTQKWGMTEEDKSFIKALITHDRRQVS